MLRVASASPRWPPVTSPVATAGTWLGWGGRAGDPPGWEQSFRDTFVPLSREELQGELLREFHPSGPARAEFLDFAARLDRSLQPRYHRYHLHLQALYGPLDPSRDTGGSPGVSPDGGERRARRVMAALAPLLAEANFQRLPPGAIAYALRVHHPQDPVEVSLRLDDYAALELWARGWREGPLPDPPPSDPPPRWTLRPPPPPPHRRYFRRLVVLARPRCGEGGSLELAAFRDVPLESLELFLGRGRPRPPPLARAFLPLGLLAWATLLFLNLGLGAMAELKVGAGGLLLLLGGAVALRGAKALGRGRARAGLRAWRARFGRVTAQHGDLVAAITRRAHDEAAKEALLARSILGPGPPGPEAESRLRGEAEAWLRRRFGVPLAFPARRACQRLRLLHGHPKNQGAPQGHPETQHNPQGHPKTAETPQGHPKTS